MKPSNPISTTKALFVLLLLSFSYISISASLSTTKNVSSIYSKVLQMYLTDCNTCSSDSDCYNDEVCNKNTGECAQCLDSSDCGCGYECSEIGQCDPVGFGLTCQTNNDCCDGHVCNDSTGECNPFRPDGCSGFCISNNDCSTECECNNGECIPFQ